MKTLMGEAGQGPGHISGDSPADDPVALRKCAGGTFLAAALADKAARGELIKTRPAVYPAGVTGETPI